MRHKTFLKSAAIVSLGGIAAKGIGALYRIPLVGLLGGYGMGLYQMAYPFFCVLLTFSSAGIPSAFARVVAKETAQGAENGETVRTALRLFALLGLAGTLVMCLLAPAVGAMQGEASLAVCYYALAPSVFFVALIAVLRGYFQGKNDMRPTAVSEIVEQSFKAAFGAFFVCRYAGDPVRAVCSALAAVSLSEVAAFGCLMFRYRGEPKRRLLRVMPPSGTELLAAAFPVMAAASLLPISQMADSVLIVRLLRYTSRSVALYGLFSGGAVSLVNLPAAVCYGFVAAAVPAVSAAFARGEEGEGRARALYAVLLTLLLSAPCAAGLFFFARPIVRLLYPSLSQGDAQTLVSLIRLSSVSAATLAGVNTLAACLTGMGRAKQAAFSMLVAVLVKFALQWLLIPNPALSVGGAAIAANSCYLVAFFLDLFYTVRRKKTQNGEKRYDHDHRAGNGKRRCHGARTAGDAGGGQGVAANGAASLCGRPAGSGDRV